MNKILIIATPLSSHGGAFSNLKLWVRYLSVNFNVRVLCCAADHNTLGILEREGAEIHKEKKLGRFGRVSVIPGVMVVSREIRSYSPDIVFSLYTWSNFLVNTYMVFMRFLGQSTVPHVVHMVGHGPLHFIDDSLSQRFYKFIARMSLKGPDRIVTNFKPEIAYSLYGADISKVDWIPAGVEFPHFEGKGPLHEPFTFGVVSRLSREKQVGVIIQVFNEVSRGTDRPLRLLIYGDGALREELESQVSDLGLGDIVFFEGWVQDPYEAFDSIDCLLMFSTTEGQGLSIVEAGLFTVPTIAGDVGGVGQTIVDGATGFLVREKVELADRMRHVLSMAEDDYVKIGLEARKYMLEHFSIEKEIESVETLIAELVGH